MRFVNLDWINDEIICATRQICVDLAPKSAIEPKNSSVVKRRSARRSDIERSGSDRTKNFYLWFDCDLRVDHTNLPLLRKNFHH